MKKFFDWLNNWFDIVSAELKQKRLEAFTRRIR